MHTIIQDLKALLSLLLAAFRLFIAILQSRITLILVNLDHFFTSKTNHKYQFTMLYAFISRDVENSLEKRLSVRDQHIARLIALKDEGRLIIAGPHPAVDSLDPGSAGFTGSLIVAEFESLKAAQKWADEDPYIETGVYESVTVKPFKHVLP